MYFYIVQPLVGKTVTMLHRASFRPVKLLVKMFIPLEERGIFGPIFCIPLYFNIVHPLICKKVMRLHGALFLMVDLFK